MPKPKRGPELFELLADDKAKGADALKVPQWWRHRRDQVASSRATPATPEKAADAVREPESLSSPRSLRSPSPGFFELQDDRIRISFNSLTAAVAVFAGLVVVLGAFELGQWMGARAGVKRGHAAGRQSYAADAADEIEAARRQPAATSLIQSLLAESDDREEPKDERERMKHEPGRDRKVADKKGEGGRMGDEPTTAILDKGGEEPARAQWIQDYTYVVAQGFPAGHADDAERAREFLAEHGVSTRQVRYPSGAIHLITTQGYNRNDSTQRRMADVLLNKVRAIGVKYSEAGGGYKLEGYFKTLKGDTW